MTDAADQRPGIPAPPPALVGGGAPAPDAAAIGLAEGVILALPEPAMLVRRDGIILAVNAAAAHLFATNAAALHGQPLAQWLHDAPDTVATYLAACARTRSPLPGAVRRRAARAVLAGTDYVGGTSDVTNGDGGPSSLVRHAVSGAVVRPAAPGAPAVVLLRFRVSDESSTRFLVLNRQLDELTREVRARRLAESVAREASERLEEQAVELELANHQLQDQAVELEFANQQLQDQAVELEQQIDQVRSYADELAGLNTSLESAATAAEAARVVAVQANRAKSDFLAVMSHELRTPLNAIGGYAELLELGVRGSMNDEQLHDLQRIQRSQRHLLSLINEVLNFARLEAAPLHYAISAVPLDPLLGTLETLITPQLQRQRLEYVYDRGPASLEATADPERLQQVLLNLLSNALKFTPPGGTIRVTADAHDDGVRIQVADTGVGIARDKRERIFEPFVQLDQRLTREHGGVGLGLAISRELVRGMGGDLTVASAPGGGSVFTVRLPAA